MSYPFPKTMPRFVGSSALRFGKSGIYVFTGSTEQTWAVPNISQLQRNKDYQVYYVKNRGTGVLTLGQQGADNFYDNVVLGNVASYKIYPGDGATIFSDGTYWIVNKTSLSGLTKSVAEDITYATTVTTLANVANMSYPLSINEEACASFTLDIGAALATSGIKLAVTVPASCSLNLCASIVPDTVTAANTITRRTTTGGAALDFTAGTLTGAGNAKLIIDVWTLNSTTLGTVQLQAAQSAAASGVNLTIRKGGVMKFNRIA